MKIIGYRTAGSPTVLAGRLDGASVVPLGTREEFWADTAAATAAAAASGAGGAGGRGALALADVEQVVLVPDAARVLCIGLNYRAHAAEGGFTPPDHPTIFGRWTASLAVGGTPVAVPAGEAGLDWEGEIAAYVGTALRDVDAETALAGVVGYSTFNDLTARRAQKLTAQWTLGKNADASGPMGPLVTADEVGDLRDGLRVRTLVNGEVAQHGSSADMVFDVGSILSLVSTVMTLHPGDVVATGTPEGVGYVRTPPWLLGPGDVVEVEVEKLGVLRTPVVGAPAAGTPVAAAPGRQGS